MPDPETSQIDPTAPAQKTLRAPLNTGKIALYFLMGICGVIMISNITHLSSSTKAAPRSTQPTKPAVTDPDNIAGFTQQQANQIAKLKQEAEELMKSSSAATAGIKPCDASLTGTRSSAPDGTTIICGPDGMWHTNQGAVGPGMGANTLSPAQEEAQRRKAELEKRTHLALASSTVAVDFSDQGNDPRDGARGDRDQPSPERADATAKAVTENTPPSTTLPNQLALVAPKAQQGSSRNDWFRYTGKLHRIFEGTILETVLTNRINGSFAGPINTMLTTNVYSHDHQTLLIPQGTRCLGTVSAVNSVNQQRLFVAFHRCIMPDGYPLDLDKFTGLNQVGETALRDLVNHHYLQIFGVSLAVGAIGGLAQIGNSTSGFVYDPAVSVRNGISQETAQESLQILNHFLNQLPTFVVREKTRVKIYISEDLEVPAYDAHIIDPAI